MSSNVMVISCRGLWGGKAVLMNRGSAVHGQAARNADDLAGDEAGVVAREERNGAGQVLRLADAAERNGFGKGFEQLFRAGRTFGHAGQQRRVGGAWAYHVHGDAVAGVLTGDGLGEGPQSALAGGIDPFAPPAAAGRVGS